MTKAVLFDCFGVLYVTPTHAFYENHIVNYASVRDELMTLNAQMDYGFLSTAEWSQQVSELTGLKQQQVEAILTGDQVRNEKLVEYIRELRRKGVLTGLLSNVGSGVMNRFFTTDETNELFDAVVLSGDVGITKPHPHIYELIAERLGVSPSECVMIDDSQQNCAGADAANMKAIRYTTVVKTMHELQRLLKNA